MIEVIIAGWIIFGKVLIYVHCRSEEAIYPSEPVRLLGTHQPGWDKTARLSSTRL